MTTAADGYPRRPWREKYREICGHFGPMFEIAWYVGVIISQYITGWQDWIITGLVLGMIVLMGRGQFEHMRNLCWRCMKIVPLAPEPEVKKHDRELRFYHWTGDRQIMAMAVMAGFMLIPLFIGLGVATFIIGDRLSPPWGALPVLGIFVYQTWVLWAHNVHQWLHPWCPYCKNWGEGGKHEEAPDPVPSGEMEIA